ncbi:hypothetical protein [Bradyrhizobium sp. AZCC 2230]|uniref:hypothetical protein n=1 Tax=Bradyrhizobium sp. AZCC 2230 TaxID=3117021 RepID=UPI002FF16757
MIFAEEQLGSGAVGGRGIVLLASAHLLAGIGGDGWLEVDGPSNIDRLVGQ